MAQRLWSQKMKKRKAEIRKWKSEKAGKTSTAPHPGPLPQRRRGKAQSSGETDLWAHGYGRAALEQMMLIHRMIEDGEYPNCTKMSGAFEMSVRTLKRDIEFMKDSLNMPIQFDVPKNGYFFKTPQPHFPRV